LAANIHYLEVGIVVLISVFVNGFVDLLIVLDAVAEVEGRLFRVLALVVGAGGLYVANIGHDQILVVTLGFDKQHFNSVARTRFHDPFAPLFGRIGGVKNSYNTTLPKPAHHVGKGCLSCGTPPALAFSIAIIEEIGRWLWGIVSTVITDIEGFGWY
jgi:hypothetical protein